MALNGVSAAANAPVSTWDLSPVVLTIAGVALVLFAQAFLRLRRRGRTDHAGLRRAVAYGCAVALATLALVSPLDTIGDRYLLSAHMLQHVLIGDAVPALLLLALRGPLLLFLLPPVILGPLARSTRLRRVLTFLLRPRVSIALWALVIAAWHVPQAYDYAAAHQSVHDFEHACFLLGGLLVWAQLIDPARRRSLRTSQRIGYAGLLFFLGLILADVLLLSFTPLYPAYADQPERFLGLSALRDQQLAGLVMMAEQLLALGTCALLLARAYRRDKLAGRPTRVSGATSVARELVPTSYRPRSISSMR